MREDLFTFMRFASQTMTPRSLLIGLLYAFFTLLTALAVVMAGYLLASAVQDAPLAQVLRIVGIVCLILLAIDSLLLLLALAVKAVSAEERRRHSPRGDGSEERSESP
jgi:hypothetical protein